MKILYQGKDIYPDVSVNHCWHDMYAGDRPDSLVIRFNDVRRLWDGWEPKPGDEIAVEEGAAKTGKMFVVSYRPENGFYTLRASALPLTAKEAHVKSWDNVTFSQLANEIAGNHGLTLKTYDLQDSTYEYVQQRNIDDFEFLQRRCELEGAAMVIYDGSVIIYDENSAESKAPTGSIEITEQDDFSFTDDSDDAFTRAELCNGKYTGKYSADSGGQDRLYRRVISLHASSQSEIDRFAKGILRAENKNAVHCVYYARELLEKYAAGSTVNITTTGAESWNGAFFITHMRNDYVFLTTKVFMRKPLGW